ncbi:hypothetical protein [Streptomyces sp. CBMA156]|uniref:hypothetical protein n=1 Tax=Streptomyces sp. CBMA156 TaxID=1930280 RepID=UPI0016620806|nr:hypothetical protein [Streptomyces sp. CBMA156]MBD0676641.1 hypothetical protein [Streptomyces sp. CBMA156]
MALITYHGIFDVIHARVTGAAHLRPAFLAVEFEGETVRLDPAEARAALWEEPEDTGLRGRIWCRAVALAQHDTLSTAIGSTEVTGWVEALVWLAAPRLERFVRQSSPRTRADRQDLESELLSAFVEELAEVSPDDPEVGDRLLRAAVRQGRKFTRGSADEYPNEHVVVIADARDARAADNGRVPASTAAADTGGAVVVPDPGSPAKVEAVRLAELTDHLGLREVVRRTHRPARGSRVGSLSLRAAGTAR